MKVKINGTEYILTFNMGFIRMVRSEYNLDLIKGEDVDGDKYFQFCYAIVYCGIQTTKASEITKEEVEKYINSLHPVEVNEFISGFTSWMTTPPKVASKEGGSKKSTFHT